MKKFFQEFKKFISRGNVMDMAVGTIIGAAFTAIVTALSNGILKPIINMVLYYCFGGDNDALDKMYTVLVKVYKVEDGKQVLDLANSILIDWGAFIINFLLVAFVLFLIIRTFNNIKDGAEKTKNIENIINFKNSKGIKLNKKELAYLEEKRAKEEASAALEAKKKEEEAKPAPKDPVVELLEEIRDSLNKNQQN